MRTSQFSLRALFGITLIAAVACCLLFRKPTPVSSFIYLGFALFASPCIFAAAQLFTDSTKQSIRQSRTWFVGLAGSGVVATLGVLLSAGLTIDFIERNPWARTFAGVATIFAGLSGSTIPIVIALNRGKIRAAKQSLQWTVLLLVPTVQLLLLISAVRGIEIPF